MIRKSPVVVFAFDAADGPLLRQWTAEGRLPVLREIMRRGCHGQLGGREYLSRHGLWATLFSGVSRARHGWYLSRQIAPGSYQLKATTSAHIDVEPFWGALRGGGHRVAIIDAPETRPLPGLEGVQLSEWGTHYAKLPPAAEPPDLIERARHIGGPRIASDERRGTRRYNRRVIDELLRRIGQKRAICRELLRDPADLMVIGFSEHHAAGHRFWDYRGMDAAREPLAGAIATVYEAIDRQMAAILADLPADSDIVVLSQAGMRQGYATRDLTSRFCRKLGYQKPSFSLRARLPASLRRFIRPGPFETLTDWDHTTAFAIPATYAGMIRVNLRGREAWGIVEPGEPYRQLLRRLEADLLSLLDRGHR